MKENGLPTNLFSMLCANWNSGCGIQEGSRQAAVGKAERIPRQRATSDFHWLVEHTVAVVSQGSGGGFSMSGLAARQGGSLASR
jgi:hypothetical protein